MTSDQIKNLMIDAADERSTAGWQDLCHYEDFMCLLIDTAMVWESKKGLEDLWNKNKLGNSWDLEVFKGSLAVESLSELYAKLEYLIKGQSRFLSAKLGGDNV